MWASLVKIKCREVCEKDVLPEERRRRRRKKKRRRRKKKRVRNKILRLRRQDKNKIRQRAVILYLGLKGKTPKQVYQDMEAILGEDAPSYSMVKKWPGKFKLGRNSLEDNPCKSRKAAQCPILSVFSHFQGLGG